jgi:hypothetical protein
MSKIIEIVRNFNVQLALKNIFTKIDEIIKKLNDVENNTSTITGTLTADQINALDTASITLLGAAGANKFYVVENASFHYKAGSVAFTAAANLRMLYNTANRVITEPISSIDLNSTTSVISLRIQTDDDFSTAIINDSIIVKTTGAISGGDGTINYSIKYRTVTTS